MAPDRARSGHSHSAARRQPRTSAVEILEQVVLLSTNNVPAEIVADERVSSWRKVLIAANTSAPSGVLPGECAVGDDGNDTVEIPTGIQPLPIIGVAADSAATSNIDITPDFTIDGTSDNPALVKIASGSLFCVGADFAERVFHINGAAVAGGAWAFGRRTQRT